MRTGSTFKKEGLGKGGENFNTRKKKTKSRIINQRSVICNRGWRVPGGETATRWGREGLHIAQKRNRRDGRRTFKG